MIEEFNGSSDVWMDHMRRGDFEEAWKFSDAYLNFRRGKVFTHLPRPYQNIWDGSTLENKKVLVRCYHGLGDTIQFIRYMPMIKKSAAQVIVWGQLTLLELLKTAKGIDKLLPLHEGEPEADYDVDIEIMECQHIFRTTLTSIPSATPYLHVEPMPLNKKKLKVGLVWKSGDWDDRRSIPFSLLAPLAEFKNIQLYILQGDAVSAGWRKGFGEYRGELDLCNYARMIKTLDLLISVDSMPAHLAGALGVPVWNLLHAEPDWRWMIDRTDSPWYPTMRLFRQQQQGNWQTVINDISKELQNLVSKK